MPKAKNVTVIPATLNIHTKTPTKERVRRRVAAYARVSTDSEEHFIPRMKLRSHSNGGSGFCLVNKVGTRIRQSSFPKKSKSTSIIARNNQ